MAIVETMEFDGCKVSINDEKFVSREESLKLLEEAQMIIMMNRIARYTRESKK